MTSACPLCSRAASTDLISSNSRAAAIWDAFPVSPGHALIVSRRHVADLFALTAEELNDCFALLSIVKHAIEAEHAPAANNVGVNVGAAAGQTVPHVHIHIIPRYEGDVADPRGGVRWVIPARADYWTQR